MDRYPNRNGENRSGADTRGVSSSAGRQSSSQMPRRRSETRRQEVGIGAPLNRKKVRNTKRNLFIVLGAVAAAVIVFVLVSAFVGVQSIEVVGAKLSSNQEITEASGIKEGGGCFGYNTAKATENILKAVPCVAKVEITRSAFGRVIISIVEKEAYWYTELFGEYFLLSEDLEVIRHTDIKSELVSMGLVRLDFPKVEGAILGRRIEITDEDRDCSFIDEFLAEVRESELYKEGRLNGIDIKTKFEISAVCDLKYKIFLGKYSSAKLKLDTARLTLEDENFKGEEPWSLDVSDLPKVITRPDETLDFSYLVP